MTVGTFFSLLQWVIVGGLAGYVASLLLKAERNGCLINVALGIAGAFVGGFVMGNFIAVGGLTRIPFLDNILNAVIGAVIILVLMELVLPGKQLGVRGDSDGGGRRRRKR